MLKLGLCDYSDAYILVSGTITITEAGADDAAKRGVEREKGVIFKTFAAFTNCINEANNTQIDNTKNIDVVMQIVDLIEYSNSCSKISGSLWQYYRDEPNLNHSNSRQE